MSLTDRNSIASVLLEQRTSFLRKSGGVTRTVLQKVERYKPLPHTVVITGLRRTGKSAVLHRFERVGSCCSGGFASPEWLGTSCSGGFALLKQVGDRLLRWRGLAQTG